MNTGTKKEAIAEVITKPILGCKLVKKVKFYFKCPITL